MFLVSEVLLHAAPSPRPMMRERGGERQTQREREM